MYPLVSDSPALTTAAPAFAVAKGKRPAPPLPLPPHFLAAAGKMPALPVPFPSRFATIPSQRPTPPVQRRPLKSAFKSSNRSSRDKKDSRGRSSSGPIKKRKVVIQDPPSVRFNEEVVEHKPRVFKTPLIPTATWLKGKDIVKIRTGVFSTLDYMRRRRDAGYVVEDWKNSGCSSALIEGNNKKHCARGLEDYSIDKIDGSLKASTVHRRQNSIRAVLFEQEIQRREFRRQQQREEASSASPSTASTNPTPRHKVCVLDPVEISRVYRSQTGANIHEAIVMGRVDSEQALAIYSERPPSHKQQHRRRHSAPTGMALLPPPKIKRRVSETTWGFAMTPPPAPTTAPPPPMAGRVTPPMHPQYPTTNQQSDRPTMHRRLVST